MKQCMSMAVPALASAISPYARLLTSFLAFNTPHAEVIAFGAQYRARQANHVELEE